MVTSVIEVLTLCGFVFGVACKIPPSLTILILNGCFCFPIGRYLIYQANNYNCKERIQGKLYSQQRHLDGYHRVTDINSNSNHKMQPVQHMPSNSNEDKSKKRYLKYFLRMFELFGFLMQLGVLVSIPVVLSNENFFSPSGRIKHYAVATYILIPVSLSVISFVWSGWIQSKSMRASGANDNIMKSLNNEEDETARLKTGNYTYCHWPALLYCYHQFIWQRILSQFFFIVDDFIKI